LLTQAQKTLTLQNTGSGNLSWQATVQDATYLTLSTSSGTLTPSQPGQQITVTASCKVVVSKTDTITISWSGGDVSVPVKITVLV
jgi:hypothetical protein